MEGVQSDAGGEGDYNLLSSFSPSAPPEYLRLPLIRQTFLYFSDGGVESRDPMPKSQSVPETQFGLEPLWSCFDLPRGGLDF